MSLFVSAVDTVNFFMLSGRFYCSETPCTVYLMKVVQGNNFHTGEYYFQF